MQRLFSPLVALLFPLVAIHAAPFGFPASGNGLWYNTPGQIWSRDYLPIGNGHLAAMSGGGTNLEILQLNIESLWSGGPFEDPTYNGGNKQPSEQATIAQSLARYQDALFQSGVIGDISDLGNSQGAYGSYAGSGYLVTTLNTSTAVTDYTRWLDLDQGLAKTSWSQDEKSFARTTFCSHPAAACVQHLASTSIPATTFAFSSALESGLPTTNVSCIGTASISVRGLAGNPGMLYELIFKASSKGGRISCTDVEGGKNATLSVSDGASETWISWVGDTEYDMDAGDAEHNFSFKGADPHSSLTHLLSIVPTSYKQILATHVSDIKSTLWDDFSLDIGQVADLDTPTNELMAAYTVANGNPYIEWLLFNYGRYLLAGSARGVLPANLQGKWADGYGNAWSADYHANINIQMNYWIAEITGMDVMLPLFDYFEKTWVPRGEYTAQVLYNITRGWVVHNEMNIFGHTGMKEGASQWANYPEAGTWMMLHVWDHFDYSGDVAWFRAQGWPLLKTTAAFQLDKLLEDRYFKDGSLVVGPCCSPEQEYITIGCAHAQQLIWQLFNAIMKGYEASGDNDPAFLAEVTTAVEKMDKGIHIGSWGQLQEWKIDHDSPTDTHRHLSHLIGLYPGYALTSYAGSTNYSKEEVLGATAVSLVHRGNGTGPDADSGWEKAWRAACWAQLGDSETFYHELKYTIQRDFGANLFSLYNPGETSPIFQIDANLGYPAALINGLIQTPDVEDNNTPFVITVLPALPDAWPSGYIRGARARKGVSIDIVWQAGKLKSVTANVKGNGAKDRLVNLVYNGTVVGSFKAKKGIRKTFIL